MDILVAYCEEWDTELKTSKYHYIKRLEKKGNRILYLEIPENPLSLILKNYKYTLFKWFPKFLKGNIKISSTIWILNGIFLLPYNRRIKLLDKLYINKLNQYYFLKRLRKNLNRLNFKDIHLICYYPHIYPIIDKLDIKKILFHIVDDWQGLAGIPHSMASLTEKMLQLSDQTVVTSQLLFNKYSKYTNNINLLRHGTDTELFNQVYYNKVKPDPRILRYNYKIKIGYYGALHKLDFKLINEIALEKENWLFIFIGPLTGNQGLNKKKNLIHNIEYQDSWKRDDLPKFLASINTFWMPFIDNDLTNSMCPIKLYEVLSSGKPIVSTELDEIKNIGNNLILHAKTKDEHISKLDYSLTEDSYNNNKKRVESVSKYDWDNRMIEFNNLLNS